MIFIQTENVTKFETDVKGERLTIYTTNPLKVLLKFHDRSWLFLQSLWKYSTLLNPHPCCLFFKPDRLHRLRIEYSGSLSNQMVGIYRTKYKHPSGQVKYGAATQFEAIYARRAFPCWDEPDFKATFVITLLTPKNRVALSNMVLYGYLKQLALNTGEY